MQKIAPSKGRLAAMVLFAFSCFAIVLFLWKSFGGPSPLAAKPYVLHADFPEATQLAQDADVRISGVKVGRVRDTELHGARTRATLYIDPRYAPLPRDTRAILRQKTLLGETYIELTPGDRSSGKLPDGGYLPRNAVAPTTQIDEITRTFDPRTRRDAQIVLSELAKAAGSRGATINGSLGTIAPFADDTTQMLRVLDSEHAAVRKLISDTGVVFNAAGERNGELAGLISAGDRVLTTTARRNADLANATRILPTTLAELRPTLAEVELVAHHAAPVVGALRPAATRLAPTLTATGALAPDLGSLFRELNRTVDISRTALPAGTRVVDAVHPVFRILVPTLQQALPVVEFLGLYKEELTAAIAGLAASTQASQSSVAGSPPLHYLRALVPFTAEGLAVQDKRFGTNRHNPYLLPLGLSKLPQGLDAFDCQNVNNPGSGQPAPPCRVQTPLPFQGRQTAFPHVLPAP